MLGNLPKKSRLDRKNGARVWTEYVSFIEFPSILIFFVVNEDITAELKRIQMEREKAVTRLNEINPRRSTSFVLAVISRQGP